MSVERDEGKMQLVCDGPGGTGGCPTTYRVYEAGDFSEMMDDAKRDGWRAWSNTSRAWRHSCGTCTAEWARGRAGQGSLL